MKNAIAIVDLGFGSSGKGLIAGYIAKRWMPDTVVCAFAPNAGHTYIDENGYEMIHRMIPNGVVSPKLKTILIGPGAVIDPVIFHKELNNLNDAGHPYNYPGKLVEVVIHPNAAVVLPEHLEDEKKFVRIGSTMKGTAAAMIERMRRDPVAPAIAANCSLLKPFVVGVEDYQCYIMESDRILIEGAQGYSLSMYHGFYPYVTARDTTTAQLLADTGIPIKNLMAVVGTMRTYPIRVANRFDSEGNQIGTSGPCYPDQREMEWSEIGREPELTTVTKLPRRLFSFSFDQIRQALFANGVTDVFCNFVEYLEPVDQLPFLTRLQGLVSAYGARLTYTGYGAMDTDVKRVTLTDPWE